MSKGTAKALIALAALSACSSPDSSPQNAISNIAVTTQQAVVAATAPTISEDDKHVVDGVIEAIYAPYRKAPTVGRDAADTDWDLPIYSAATKKLIEQWKGIRVEGEMVSMLEEAGWFCQCQDWFDKGFKFLDKTIKPLPDGQAEAAIRFDLGDGEVQNARILFVREGTDWKVADLFTPALPKGLISQIKADLTENGRK